ncbi:ectoine/hydroxyectoine ABC transporter permease subunit EhuD [Ochrobactrum teleogrylli]
MSNEIWDWSFAYSVIPYLLSGFKITLIATLLSSILAFVLGLVWVLIRLARIPVITPIVIGFLEFLRSTPVLIQLYFLFYVLPTWGVAIPALTTGIIGLGLCTSAYVAEIYRAGIEEIPQGQWEASLTLGLPLRHVWGKIILPQAMKTTLPVLVNEIIAMFKLTAQLSTITVLEMAAQAKNIGSLEFRYIEPLTMAGIFYVTVCYSVSLWLRRLEK